MKNFFVVLGGMGTLATESFVHLLNERSEAHCDQDYPNYLVVNHATVPDRTAYIIGENKESPYPALKEDIEQYSALKPNFFVLTCNTAHYFYEQLQAQTQIPILHMPRQALEVINEKAAGKPARVMLLATKGTVEAGVYNKEFARFPQLDLVLPKADLQEEVMRLIYEDVKEKQYFNAERYHRILQTAVEDYTCDYIILGCTELSLMEEKCPGVCYPVIDAQAELVNAVLRQK